VTTELKELKQRIASTRQIERVTSTLQRVAAARMARDRHAITNARAYLEGFRLILRSVAAVSSEPRHPLQRAHARGGKLICLVVFGAERGLCGGFTAGLIEEMEKFACSRKIAPECLEVVVMGKMTARGARRAGFRVARSLPQAPVAYATAEPEEASKAGLKEVLALSALVTSAFLNGVYKAVFLLFSFFQSALRQQPTIMQLLPVEPLPDPLPGCRLALLEPSADAILDRVLPEYVEMCMYHGFLNSLGSENAARQLAMNRATENARNLLNQLVIAYRRLRQDTITNEILELFRGESAAEE